MSLHITVGCMYSSKTTTLIQKYHTMEFITIIIDYDTTQNECIEGHIHNHTTLNLPCIKCVNLFDAYQMESLNKCVVIMINEAQFFKDLIPFVEEMLKKGKTIYVYGLDGDYKQEKIGHILDLIPLCDTIQKLKAKCICGDDAIFSHRDSSETDQYQPNATYMPLCRKCNNKK